MTAKRKHQHTRHLAREASAAYSIREAKLHFSALIRQAEEGLDITVTSHGRPMARIVPIQSPSKPFHTNRNWLAQPHIAKRQTPAEALIRADRDG